MNCRDCINWDVKETMRINRDIAKQGFAKCKLDTHKARFFSAGWYCGKWEQAAEESIEARKKVGAY